MAMDVQKRRLDEDEIRREIIRCLACETYQSNFVTLLILAQQQEGESEPCVDDGCVIVDGGWFASLKTLLFLWQWGSAVELYGTHTTVLACRLCTTLNATRIVTFPFWHSVNLMDVRDSGKV